MALCLEAPTAASVVLRSATIAVAVVALMAPPGGWAVQGMSAMDAEWDEENDEALKAVVAGLWEYSGDRLLVVPWSKNDTDDGEKWNWFQPDGMEYIWKSRPKQKDSVLDIHGDTVEDEETVLGILEFADLASHADEIELYKTCMKLKSFKEVHFDRRVHIAQIPQVFEPRDAPSPASDQFNPLGWDRVAEYRGKIVNLIKGFKSMTYVTPTDSKWPEEYDIRQIRGDYTLQSDWPTTGHGAVVAVLDTGCVLGHEDLQPNLWVNEAEANGAEGVDDDGNGFVDDVHGYNFVSDTGDVADDNGHGSHVAGIISAVVNNTFGVVGLAPNAKIMCLKFMDEQGSGFTSAAVLAMAYAIQMNATVQNHSWGSPGSSLALQRIARLSGRLGQILAAAAGNDGIDTDVIGNMTYPAALSSPELFPETSDYIISVGASDENDRRASFSNYGVTTVDISAPGTDILSLDNIASRFVRKQGTSMATPLVAATAAIVSTILCLQIDAIGIANVATAADKAAYTKHIIMATIDKIETLQGASRTGGRLNVFSAVQLAATGDKAYIVAVPITEVNEPMEWWLILLIVLVAASTVIGVVVYCWAKPRPPPHEKYGTQMAPMSNANYPAGQL